MSSSHAVPPHLIPRGRTRIEHRVSNSRFIATIAHAASVEEAKAFIQEIRDEMPDATHHVFAFRIGHGSSVTEGMSDDGEPSGTSGPPALAVLRGSGVGDAVLVITRYFGGTKLGTGGLVAAYGESAKLTMAAVATEEKIERRAVKLTIPYSLHDDIRRLLEAHGAQIEEEIFEADVRIQTKVPVSELARLSEALQARTGGKLRIAEAG